MLIVEITILFMIFVLTFCVADMMQTNKNISQKLDLILKVLEDKKKDYE